MNFKIFYLAQFLLLLEIFTVLHPRRKKISLFVFDVLKTPYMCSIGMWNLTRKQNLGANWIDNASINRMKSICNKSYHKDRDLAAELIKDPVKCWKSLVDSLQTEKIKNNSSVNQNKSKKKRKRKKESMSNRKMKNKCIKRSH